MGLSRCSPKGSRCKNPRGLPSRGCHPSGLVCGEMPRERARAQLGPCGVGTGQGLGCWWLWRHRGACSRHGFPPPAPLWEPRAFLLLLLLPHRGVSALLWGSAVKSKSVNPHGVTKHALCKPLRSHSPPPPPKSPVQQERGQAPGSQWAPVFPPRGGATGLQEAAVHGTVLILTP